MAPRTRTYPAITRRHTGPRGGRRGREPSEEAVSVSASEAEAEARVRSRRSSSSAAASASRVQWYPSRSFQCASSSASCSATKPSGREKSAPPSTRRSRVISHEDVNSRTPARNAPVAFGSFHSVFLSLARASAMNSGVSASSASTSTSTPRRIWRNTSSPSPSSSVNLPTDSSSVRRFRSLSSGAARLDRPSLESAESCIAIDPADTSLSASLSAGCNPGGFISPRPAPRSGKPPTPASMFPNASAASAARLCSSIQSSTEPPPGAPGKGAASPPAPLPTPPRPTASTPDAPAGGASMSSMSNHGQKSRISHANTTVSRCMNPRQGSRHSLTRKSWSTCVFAVLVHTVFSFHSVFSGSRWFTRPMRYRTQ